MFENAPGWVDAACGIIGMCGFYLACALIIMGLMAWVFGKFQGKLESVQPPKRRRPY